MVRVQHGPPPSGRTRPHRLARSRTPAFHAGDRGSNPLGDANNKNRGLRQKTVPPVSFRKPHTQQYTQHPTSKTGQFPLSPCRVPWSKNPRPRVTKATFSRARRRARAMGRHSTIRPPETVRSIRTLPPVRHLCVTGPKRRLTRLPHLYRTLF